VRKPPCALVKSGAAGGVVVELKGVFTGAQGAGTGSEEGGWGRFAVCARRVARRSSESALGDFLLLRSGGLSGCFHDRPIPRTTGLFRE